MRTAVGRASAAAADITLVATRKRDAHLVPLIRLAYDPFMKVASTRPGCTYPCRASEPSFHSEVPHEFVEVITVG
jgi:hypothetical protein